MFLGAVLGIARTSPWRDLPPKFGNWNTVFKRISRFFKVHRHAQEQRPTSRHWGNRDSRVVIATGYFGNGDGQRPKGKVSEPSRCCFVIGQRMN
jgi:hypothetical protein